MDNTAYLELKSRHGDIIYTHCRECMPNKPEGMAPSEWANLEGIIDLKNGVLTIGCQRCNLPIVSAMVSRDLVQHIGQCGCEQCRMNAESSH